MILGLPLTQQKAEDSSILVLGQPQIISMNLNHRLNSSFSHQ